MKNTFKTMTAVATLMLLSNTALATTHDVANLDRTITSQGKPQVWVNGTHDNINYDNESRDTDVNSLTLGTDLLVKKDVVVGAYMSETKSNSTYTKSKTESLGLYLTTDTLSNTGIFLKDDVEFSYTEGTRKSAFDNGNRLGFTALVNYFAVGQNFNLQGVRLTPELYNKTAVVEGNAVNTEKRSSVHSALGVSMKLAVKLKLNKEGKTPYLVEPFARAYTESTITNLKTKYKLLTGGKASIKDVPFTNGVELGVQVAKDDYLLSLSAGVEDSKDATITSTAVDFKYNF